MREGVVKARGALRQALFQDGTPTSRIRRRRTWVVPHGKVNVAVLVRRPPAR